MIVLLSILNEMMLPLRCLFNHSAGNSIDVGDLATSDSQSISLVISHLKSCHHNRNLQTTTAAKTAKLHNVNVISGFHQLVIIDLRGYGLVV